MGFFKKAFSKVFRHYGPGGQYIGSYGPSFVGETYDYRAEVGDLHHNGVISSIINYVVRKAGEASLEPYVLKNDIWVPMSLPSVRNIWHKPNDYHSFPELISGIVTSLYDSGNAYLIKRRNSLGRLTGLYYVSHKQMTPKASQNSPDGIKLITHYTYIPAGGVEEDFDVSEVIHFRWGIDIDNPAMGVTPFVGVYRDIALDNTSAVSAAALIRNQGRVGAIFSPKSGIEAQPPTVEQRRSVEALYNSYVRDKSGKAFFTPLPMDITFPGMDSEELQILSIREQASARICAPAGIDVMTINLPSPHKTYANYSEANESGLENCFLQVAGIIAQQFTNQTEGELPYKSGEFKWEWCTDRMRGLRGDLDKAHARVRADWEKNLMDLYEARQVLRLPVDDSMRGVMYEPKVPAGAETPAKPPQDGLGRPAKSADLIDNMKFRALISRAVEELYEDVPASSQ